MLCGIYLPSVVYNFLMIVPTKIKTDLFINSFFTSPAKFSELDAGNVILFQIKVFCRNIKETTLARHFIKVTARPSLRVKSH